MTKNLQLFNNMSDIQKKPGTMGKMPRVHDPTHQRLHLVEIQIHLHRGPEVRESLKGFPNQNNRPKNSGSVRKRLTQLWPNRARLHPKMSSELCGIVHVVLVL